MFKQKQHSGSVAKKLLGSGFLAVTISLLPQVAFGAPLPVVQLELNGNQSTVNGVYSVVEFEATLDTIGAWDSDQFRYTPNVAGYYTVSGSLYCTTSAQDCYLIIRKNGVFLGGGIETAPSPAINAVYTVYLNGTTDYVDYVGFSSAGVAFGDDDTLTYGTIVYEGNDNPETGQSVDNPALNIALGIFIFFMSMFFIVWYFRGRIVN